MDDFTQRDFRDCPITQDELNELLGGKTISDIVLVKPHQKLIIKFDDGSSLDIGSYPNYSHSYLTVSVE